MQPGAEDAIVYVAQGDMRKAINALQGAAIVTTQINEDMIYEITSTARPEEIAGLMQTSVAGDYEGGAEALVHDLLYSRGDIAPNELINQMYRSIIKIPLERRLKTQLIAHLGETDFRLSEGANSEIQMEALIANIVLSADAARQ